jgi:hypothetical protein
MVRRKQPSTPEEQLEILEAHLAGTLKPVAPSRDIVHRLRGRIQFPPRGEIVLRLRDWRALMLAFGGVMSGMLLFITIARALYYLVGRKNVM